MCNNEVLAFQFGERFVGLEITNVKGFIVWVFRHSFGKRFFFSCVRGSNLQKRVYFGERIKVPIWFWYEVLGFQKVFNLCTCYFRFEKKNKSFWGVWFWISRKIAWFENTSTMKRTLIRVGTVVSFGWVHPLF